MIHRLKTILSSPAPTHKRKRGVFIVAWMKSPMKIGGIFPSSRSLARAMAQTAAIHADGGMVIELGAGTGMVTHALLEAGITPKQLIVVERETSLLDILHTQFPQLALVQEDAIHLHSMLLARSIEEVEVVVSSLPLLTMPKLVREAIEEQMVAAIGKHGKIVQFTYGAHSPIPQTRWQEHHIYGMRITRVIANIPPAYIWLYLRDRRAQPR
jgi:phosphatidylethanolamine/phosphatidyl-N-methylethanolamine N-methyltransferase